MTTQSAFTSTDPLILESIGVTEEIAWMIGCFLGDGHCGKHQRHYTVLFTGDSRVERPMYESLQRILKKIDPSCAPKIFERESNTICLRAYSKLLFETYTTLLKLPHGNKTMIASVPAFLEGELDLRCMVARGLFDTDGCVFLDERKRYARPYPRLHWVSKSPHLAKFMDELLTDLGIKHYCYTHEKRQAHVVDVYGHKNIDKWMETIGFSNPRHHARILPP